MDISVFEPDTPHCSCNIRAGDWILNGRFHEYRECDGYLTAFGDFLMINCLWVGLFIQKPLATTDLFEINYHG